MAAIGTPTYLGHNTQEASSAALDITLSGAIPAGALAFCSVAVCRTDSTSPVAPTSVAGGGVSWDLESSVQYDVAGGQRGSLFVYRAAATTPSGTTVTVTPGYVGTMAAGVCYVSGAAVGNNGADALVQEVTAVAGAVAGGANLATAVMATLSNTTEHGFLMFTAAVSSADIRTFSPETSPAMAEVPSFDFGAGTATMFTMQQAAYIIGTTEVNPSLASTAISGTDASGVVAYEIAAASAAAGPTIDTQPVADTVLINGDAARASASFTVAATGTGTLSYQWELETSVGGGTYANVADGDGATWAGATTTNLTATFTVKTLTGRRVRCVVTDDNGSTTSSAVALTVYTGPVLSASSGTTNASGVSTVDITSDYPNADGEFTVVTATAGGVTKQVALHYETPA